MKAELLEYNILIGANAARKTNLLKTIFGLLKDIRGIIYYDDLDLKDISYRDKGKLISFIPQNIHTDQNYSILDIVVMGITPYLSLFETPREDRYEIGRQINIYYLKDNSIGELSGGERRMVYLGRVLMQKCKIILLDEPNTFLDYLRQHDFFTFINRFVKENKLITLFTIHDINLALRYVDRIHILDKNKIIDVVNCREIGYEKRMLESLRRIYKRDFYIVDTKVGPMIIC